MPSNPAVALRERLIEAQAAAERRVEEARVPVAPVTGARSAPAAG